MLSTFLNIRVLFIVAVVFAVQVSACGGDDERVKKAAKWLKNFTQVNPPNGGWVTTNIEVASADKVVMDVLVPMKQQVDQIKSRSKIEQSLIVSLACPPKNAEIWTILDGDQTLWVNLTARKSDGLTETLIGASCKH